MCRIMAIFVSLGIITVSLLGANASAGSEFHMLLTINQDITLLRISAAFVLLVYALYPSFRFMLSKGLLFLCSLLATAVILVGIFSSDHFYIRPVDFFIALEYAIFSAIAVMDFPSNLEGTRQPTKVPDVISSLTVLTPQTRR